METEREPLPARRMATALFLLSFATVMFTITLFRLLTFFIMPSLFFDLLFIGFPLGALAGAWLYRASRSSFLATLWTLQGAMLFSVLAMLACKHLDYLRAHLFDVELQRLLVQMLAFTALFLPFFVAYGLSEYIGYQVGRRNLRGRMRVVYAVYLFGAAAAYVVAELLFPLLGAARLLTLPFLLVAVAMLMLGAPGPRTRLALAAQPLAVAALLVAPGIEAGFLDLYKGSSMQSTHAYAARGYETVHQQWGRYSLIEVMQVPGDEGYVGFYNDIIQWWYAPGNGFVSHSIGMLPIERAPPGGSIAIIGAGAGRQVQYARRSGRDLERIVAIEIEPAIVEAVNGRLAERFDHVYHDPRVELVVHEARSYMERSDQRFDLIYLPSVGGYPQMMLEPGNMIRTLEAYRTLAQRLSERGVLAIWYPTVLDPRTILTEQYVHTLESGEIGLAVRAFRNAGEFLILAARRIEQLPTLEEVREFYLRPATDAVGADLAPLLVDLPVEVPRRRDPAAFRPIRDDRPFLAGNVQHIFSVEQVTRLLLIVAGLLLALSAALMLLLRRRGDPGIPGRSFVQVVTISLLVGANFLVLEHYLILALFEKLYVYRDALVLGAVGFLVITGLGSTFITARRRPALQLTAGLLLVPLVLFHAELPAWADLALLAPVALVTGSFFPALFEAAAQNPLAVFAADAVGAAAGSMASFFIPIVLGFDAFFLFAGAVFWATALATFLFFRGARPPATP